MGDFVVVDVDVVGKATFGKSTNFSKDSKITTKIPAYN
jgi:hypothetical protein